MDQLETTSHAFRRARTRSMIQLAGLMEKAGLVETFGVRLGLDLQRDPEQKHQVATLYKGLVELNQMAQSNDVHHPTWSIQGLQLFGDEKKKNSFKKGKKRVD
jgi:predicted chitinase